MIRKIEVNGVERYVHGILRYPSPPEVGTVIGPNDIGEHLVVVGQDGAGTLVAYATAPDLIAAREHAASGGTPRSMTERAIRT